MAESSGARSVARSPGAGGGGSRRLSGRGGAAWAGWHVEGSPEDNHDHHHKKSVLAKVKEKAMQWKHALVRRHHNNYRRSTTIPTAWRSSSEEDDCDGDEEDNPKYHSTPMYESEKEVSPTSQLPVFSPSKEESLRMKVLKSEPTKKIVEKQKIRIQEETSPKAYEREGKYPRAKLLESEFVKKKVEEQNIRIQEPSPKAEEAQVEGKSPSTKLFESELVKEQKIRLKEQSLKPEEAPVEAKSQRTKLFESELAMKTVEDQKIGIQEELLPKDDESDAKKAPAEGTKEQRLKVETESDKMELLKQHIDKLIGVNEVNSMAGQASQQVTEAAMNKPSMKSLESMAEQTEGLIEKVKSHASTKSPTSPLLENASMGHVLKHVEELAQHHLNEFQQTPRAADAADYDFFDKALKEKVGGENRAGKIEEEKDTMRPTDAVTRMRSPAAGGHDNKTKVRRPSAANEIAAKMSHDKGVSMKQYLMQKLKPGEEERVLSEVITKSLSTKMTGGIVAKVKVAVSTLLAKEPPIPVSTHPRAVEVDARRGLQA